MRHTDFAPRDVEWAIARIKRLEAALLGLKRGRGDLAGNPCFCEAGIGNPMMQGSHSEACKEAVAVLNEDP